MAPRRDWKDDRAVSEIVGALMLVLIVVGAATAFGTFAIKAREEAGEAKLLETRRATEALEVLDISLDAIENSDEYGGWTFSIFNPSDRDLRLIDVRLNGAGLSRVYVQEGSFYDGDADTLWDDWETQHFGDTTTTDAPGDDADGDGWTNIQEMRAQTDPLDDDSLANDEWVDVARDHYAVRGRGVYSIYVDDDWYTDARVVDLDLRESLALVFFTQLQNRFETVYIPPTAIGFVEQQAPTALYLDGSLSDHPGDDARIIQWRWDFTVGASHPQAGTYTVYGRHADSGIDCDGTIAGGNEELTSLTLTVSDQYGMQATVSLADHDC